jgi:hypothetical protein
LRAGLIIGPRFEQSNAHCHAPPAKKSPKRR